MAKIEGLQYEGSASKKVADHRSKDVQPQINVSAPMTMKQARADAIRKAIETHNKTDRQSSSADKSEEE